MIVCIEVTDPKQLIHAFDIIMFINFFSSTDRQVNQLQFQVDKMKEENFALESGINLIVINSLVKILSLSITT